MENTSIFECFVILDQRDYICEFCARAFKSSHNLAVHRMIHTGEKPLQLVYLCAQFLLICSPCLDIYTLSLIFRDLLERILSKLFPTGVKSVASRVVRRRLSTGT